MGVRRRLRRSGTGADPEAVKVASTCSELALAMGYLPGAYGAIVVTDGSGTRWGEPTGSAAVIKRPKFKDHLLLGRASSGTSQTAELDAVLLALRYLHAKKAHLTKGGCKVLFVTDSTLVEKNLLSVAKDPVKLYNSSAHPDSAAALLAFARRGFQYVVEQIGRNSNPLHSGVDDASRAMRLNKDPRKAYRIAFQKALTKARTKQNG